MIQAHTRLRVIDNSGARTVQCIKVLGGSKRKIAQVGDIIVVSVKEAIPRGKVKKGEVLRALVVGTSKETIRKDGTYLKFDSNNAVLLNPSNLPIGTRVLGVVSNELRQKKFLKVISLSEGVV